MDQLARALAVAWIVPSVAYAQTLSRQEILDGADARIAEHRMGDAVVRVTDANGEPISGATVRIEQVRHDFLFGCNLFGWSQPTEADASRYRDQFAALFNFATLPFYWGSFEGEQGTPAYDRIDPVVDWCQARGITTKGHPLVWNVVVPGWLGDDLEVIRALSNTRVRDIITHYRGRIGIWDVVNEATDPFRFENKMTQAWRLAGRIPFAIEPFVIAREANPEATLLINDYRTDEAYAETIRQLVSAEGRALYDAIGIQSHMHGGPWPAEHTWQVCERFAQFGVPLHFTEATVVSGSREGEEKWGSSTPEGEEAQAEAVAELYTIVFSHPATRALTWWDFADRNAWMGAPAGLLRADLSPKPAYDRLVGLIKGKWWTQTGGETDDQGQYAFRGFFGAYRIHVTGAQGAEVSADVHLERGADNVFTVKL